MLEVRYLCQTCGQTHTLVLTCTQQTQAVALIAEDGDDGAPGAPCSASASKTLVEAPIEMLHLSPRPYNALKRAGIETVAQYLALTDDDLLELRNLGPKSMRHIRDQLVLKGYVTRAEADERWGPWP